MDLSNIIIKRKKAPKRLGRGTGSTTGKTGGRGNNGSGQRKGKKTPYAGYRGGSLTFARALPKRGFTPPRRKEYQEVNLADIKNISKDVVEVTPEILKNRNIIRDEKKPIKVLAKIDGEFKVNVIVKVDKFSLRAKELIESAGGKAECLKR